jgi:hypothetical protein
VVSVRVKRWIGLIWVRCHWISKQGWPWGFGQVQSTKMATSRCCWGDHRGRDLVSTGNEFVNIQAHDIASIASA